VDVINVGQAPVGVAALGAYVWVAVSGTRQVDQVSVATNQVVEQIPVGNQPSAITAGYGAVWVSNLSDSTVSRIDPVTDTTRTTFDVFDSTGTYLGPVSAGISLPSWGRQAWTRDGLVTVIEDQDGRPTVIRLKLTMPSKH